MACLLLPHTWRRPALVPPGCNTIPASRPHHANAGGRVLPGLAQQERQRPRRLAAFCETGRRGQRYSGNGRNTRHTTQRPGKTRRGTRIEEAETDVAGQVVCTQTFVVALNKFADTSGRRNKQHHAVYSRTVFMKIFKKLYYLAKFHAMYASKKRELNENIDNYADLLTLNPVSQSAVIPKK